MRYLVTGGAGFIGSHLVDLLISRGDEVCVVDNLSLGKEENLERHFGNPRFQFLRLDMSDHEQAKKALQNGRVDMVYHLTANSDIQASAANRRIDLNDTFLSTWNVLENMAVQGVRRFAFMSSSAVFGSVHAPSGLNEDFGPLQPVSYYGAAKLASEGFVSCYAHMNGIKSWIFRFPNVVGERATHGVVYDFINKLKRNREVLGILGNGRQEKPYIYVHDLLDAMQCIVSRCDDLVNVVHIGVDTTVTVEEIARIVCEEMGLGDVEFTFQIGTNAGGGWKGDVPQYRYNLSKLYQLGWKPPRSSKDAIRIAARRILDDTSRRSGGWKRNQT